MDRVVSRILLFGFGTIACAGIPAAVFRNASLDCGIRIADLFDLALVAPFLSTVFYLIYQALVEGGVKRKWINYAIVISFFVFFEGHGMHFTANSLHNLVDDAGMEIPRQLYSLIYYYDEDLGHKLIYGGFVGLVLCGAYLQLLNPRNPISNFDNMALFISCAIFGGGATYAVFEGQTAFEAMVGVPAFLLAALIYLKVRKRELRRIPFILFIIYSMIWMILGMLAYYSLFGFSQPSEIFE